MSGPEVHRIHVDGQPAWDKRYGSRTRQWRLNALDLTVRALGVTALRPPPRWVGEAACEAEARRLDELASIGVHVPSVLDAGSQRLVLSDMGQTLAHRLRTSDAKESALWFSRAALDIADVHQKHSYLGQPVARNLTVNVDRQIGFLDFEEDPAEVMTLTDAQERDWLVFAAGSVRHLTQHGRELCELISLVLAKAQDGVRLGLRSSVQRLGFLAWLSRWGGSRASGIGKAIQTLKVASTQLVTGLLVLSLSLDYLHDGDFEVVQWIVAWIG